MTNLFQLSEPQPFDEGYAAGDDECSCPNPDDQYLLEIDNGAVFLSHRACGKQPRGDYMDLVEMAQIPVTIKSQPYGSCDGSEWHGEYRCDCGIALVATVNGLTVVHDDVPYLARTGDAGMTARIPSPNSCRHCGIDRRGHAQQWTTESGWHTWTPPAQDQILARMRARRAAPKES